MWYEMEKPRLVALSVRSVDRKPNVLIVSGLPWYATELAVQQYLLSVYPEQEPCTTRIYSNPVNGVSRGHCFVEYNSHSTSIPTSLPASATTSSSQVDLWDLQQKIEAMPFECSYLTAAVYYLTSSRWDREGRLPDIPTDPPPLRRGILGYGGEGFSVRCSAVLGLPNTVTEEGKCRLRGLRKRWRARAASHSSTDDAERT